MNTISYINDYYESEIYRVLGLNQHEFCQYFETEEAKSLFNHRFDQNIPYRVVPGDSIFHIVARTIANIFDFSFRQDRLIKLVYLIRFVALNHFEKYCLQLNHRNSENHTFVDVAFYSDKKTGKLIKQLYRRVVEQQWNCTKTDLNNYPISLRIEYLQSEINDHIHEKEEKLRAKREMIKTARATQPLSKVQRTRFPLAHLSERERQNLPSNTSECVEKKRKYAEKSPQASTIDQSLINSASNRTSPLLLPKPSQPPIWVTRNKKRLTVSEISSIPPPQKRTYDIAAQIDLINNNSPQTSMIRKN